MCIDAPDYDRLLDGIRFQFLSEQPSPIVPFYWYDIHDVPDPAFWAEAERIFTLLATRAKQQRQRARVGME